MDHLISPQSFAGIVPQLAESNWSNRQIAEIAGVSNQTVMRARTAPNGAVDAEPAKTLGADVKRARSSPPSGCCGLTEHTHDAGGRLVRFRWDKCPTCVLNSHDADRLDSHRPIPAPVSTPLRRAFLCPVATI